MIIKARMLATPRTRRVLKEHSTEGHKLVQLTPEPRKVSSLSNRRGHFFSCSGCDWGGWLATGEIEVDYEQRV